MSPDKMKHGIRYPWRNAEDLASTAAGYEDGLFSARHNLIFSRTCGDYSSDRLSRLSRSSFQFSLADAIPRPRQYRFVNLPDVLSDSDVDRILTSADRSTALGRRDYAILLLATRYGLRPCEI